MDLENKVALVTGAGVRIGQAVAVKLGQLGMRLVIHYHHSEEGAKQTIQKLPGKKSRHLAIQADLKDVYAIKELVNKAEKLVGHVSVLVNNAAEFFPTPLFSTTEEEIFSAARAGTPLDNRTPKLLDQSAKLDI